MLPISDKFIYILPFLGLFVVSSFSFIAMRKRRIFGLIPLVILTVVLVWKFPQSGGDGYEGLGFLLLLVAMSAIVVVSAIWTAVIFFGVKKIIKRPCWNPDTGIVQKILIGLILLPPLLISSVLLEAQYVPDASCSNDAVIFTIGKHSYTVGLEFQPRIERDQDISDKRQILHYSNRSQDKEDMKAICDATDDGNTPIEAVVIWISPAAIQSNIYNICHGELGQAPNYCSQYSPEIYQDISTIRLVRYPEEDLRGFKCVYVEKTQCSRESCTGGDLSNGYYCSGVAGFRRCNMWREVDSEVGVTAKSMEISNEKDYEEILLMLDRAVDFTLIAFSADIK